MVNAIGTETEKESRLRWWKDAKFGMFVHWGVYSLLGRGEWVMYASKIPVSEYEKLASEFNPVEFDAKEWVDVARRAGMKYIVITAKHHDGFAMYRSKADPFNIVDASPFGRDPMKELADACREAGIRLCFYYSHVIDWHHPHALHDTYNNLWDYELEKKAFYSYWNNKAKGQIRELLSEYGPVGLLWFDTSGGLSRKESEAIVAMIRELQPDCLINSRVSHWPGFGDYQSKGDNEIPMYGEETRPWETPMTLNQSWGYSTRDQVWKTADALVRKMVHIVSKGGNLLLNVGPTELGVIPEKSVERLEEVGAWLGRNGEAIYGTGESPFPYELEWGAVTVKPGVVYLHVYNGNWPNGELVLNGLKNNVRKAYALADPERRPLDVRQEYRAETDHHTMAVRVPEHAPDDYVSVIALEIEGEPDVDRTLVPQASGSLKADLALADIAEGSGTNTARWSFKAVEPGLFDVVLVSFKKSGAVWEREYDHEVSVEAAGRSVACVPKEDRVVEDSISCQHPYQEIHSVIGRIAIEAPGTHTLVLRSRQAKPKPAGPEIWQAAAVKLRSVKLVRV
ncbi:alpha-L-fucosidase [Paenibacillus flagellatus]|uniref:alpha-L-fucosidase n=1 Tax=Paenibacillus flagellatus TaxID=2211139 RepID=A0A2V5JXU8_9BACL|nr:alpha-L-fucosidase [Paenibacillus flagellatus]PYI51521.1 alpha-L-fucosidase [Paenibacillus flagellatus]